MREGRFVRLAVPQTSSGQIGAIRRIKHGWTFPIAERSPTQVGDISNELVEAWINKVDELQLEDRTFPVTSKATANTKDRRFGERRIKNLLRELR